MFLVEFLSKILVVSPITDDLLTKIQAGKVTLFFTVYDGNYSLFNSSSRNISNTENNEPIIFGAGYSWLVDFPKELALRRKR